jgi:hypothetical protein
MTRSIVVAMALFTGCGELRALNPNWVDDADTDTDTDTDADTDVDVDTDTDTDTDGLVPPRLDQMTATDVGTQIEVSFVVSDEDDDLVGGAFELTVNGGTTAYAIPYDLATWTASSGTGTVRFPIPASGGSGGCGGGGSASYSLTGRIEDAAGLRSGTKSTSISVESTGGGGVSIPEVGDSLDAVAPLGSASLPCSFVGDMHSTGAGAAYGDLDLFSFTPTVGASVLRLTWTGGGADYDVYVFDETSYLLFMLFEDVNFAMAWGTNEGPSPENVPVALTANTPYYVVVGGWNGPGGAYTVAIQ